MKNFMLQLVVFQSLGLFSQSDLLAELESNLEPEIQFVKSSWKSPYLINAYTTETERKGVLDFRISHRFGNLAGENGGGHTLFGLDQASNIRFSFDYGVTEDFQIGFGRSKTKEHLDFLLKYKLLKQKKEGMPISAAVLSNSAFTPKRDPNEYFSKIAHRLMFINQLVIGRKFSDNLSLLTNISHFHKNLVVQKANQDLPRDQNDLFLLGLGVRYKLNRKFSLVGEYNHTFGAYRNSKEIEYYHPLSLGIELETGGHVFHINLSNSSGLIYQDLLDSGVDSYRDGEIKLGFTISRFFVI